MKQILKAVLTMMCVVLMTSACRTSSHSTVERRTQSVERQREAKTDTVSEHTADSVLVYVERGDSIVHIIERKVHTREKLKVVRDTVVVYVQNDSIVTKEVVKEKTSRSPPRWKRILAILGLLVIVLVAVKLLTILKHFKL
jgi:hypothetical protein